MSGRNPLFFCSVSVILFYVEDVQIVGRLLIVGFVGSALSQSLGPFSLILSYRFQKLLQVVCILSKTPLTLYFRYLR